MTVLYGKGYSEQDRLSYREIVFSNVVQSMKVVMDAMDSLGIQFQNPDNLVYKTCIVEQPAQIEGDVLAPEIVTAIKCLWNDEGVKSCFARSREYQLNDSSS
jgi:guanine nucleotide-binding protein G(i) subunit alpha